MFRIRIGKTTPPFLEKQIYLKTWEKETIMRIENDGGNQKITLVDHLIEVDRIKAELKAEHQAEIDELKKELVFLVNANIKNAKKAESKTEPKTAPKTVPKKSKKKES